MGLAHAAAIGLCAGLLGCADSRCDPANCDAAAEGCRVEPIGMPNSSVCSLAGLSPPDAAAWARDQSAHCAQVCGASGAGQAIGCAANLKATCAAEPSPAKRAAIIDSCFSGPPDSAERIASRSACVDRCFAAEPACSRACPVTDWDSCYGCAKGCGFSVAQCIGRCG